MNERPAKPAPQRSGSSMSSKQLAWTVVEGRKVTFRFPPSREFIMGYLCGMDDFHWMVIDDLCKKHLIHKGSAAIIDLHDRATYADEPQHEKLEQVVRPFRHFVQERYFGRTEQERVSA